MAHLVPEISSASGAAVEFKNYRVILLECPVAKCDGGGFGGSRLHSIQIISNRPSLPPDVRRADGLTSLCAEQAELRLFRGGASHPCLPLISESPFLRSSSHFSISS